MNKIISANISGFVFQIDELAYTKLKAYLDMVRQKVGNTEVSQDIENRIAELFDEKLKQGKSAIFDTDVDEVMQQIGKPEQFGSDEQADNPSAASEHTNIAETKVKRRLYRNNDDKVIGGVCSGIAAYFSLDPVIIRLAFAATFLFFGTGFILYILLMIVLPKAITPGEKLEMRGEPADYKNLSKTIEKDFKEAYQRYKPEVKTGFERFLEIAVRIGMIMLMIFLVSIFIPGCFGIITGIGIASWSLPALSSYMFTTEYESVIILIGLFLFLMIPLFGILFSILRFAFKFKPMKRVFSVLLSVLWFTGFSMLAYSTYRIGMQFSASNKISHVDTLHLNNKGRSTLIIRTNTQPNHSEFLIEDEDGDRHISIHSQNDLKEALDQEISKNVKLNIIQGFSPMPLVRITRQSNGKNRAEAGRNASYLNYHYELRDSVLYLDETFGRGEQVLWRNQKVVVTVELPLNYRLFIDRSCHSILRVDYSDEDEIMGRYLKVDHNGIRAVE